VKSDVHSSLAVLVRSPLARSPSALRNLSAPESRVPLAAHSKNSSGPEESQAEDSASRQLHARLDAPMHRHLVAKSAAKAKATNSLITFVMMDTRAAD
jgi:hypothetical protein